jgi:hypothetical protein
MLQDFYLLLFLYVRSIKEKEQGLSGLARKHDTVKRHFYPQAVDDARFRMPSVRRLNY